MLLSISYKYSYFKWIFNYTRKGLWKGIPIRQNWDTSMSFHLWTFDCGGHCCKALLWKNSIWEIQINIQSLDTNGQGNGPSLKGSYKSTFAKHLLEFDPTFGSKFLKYIQDHYHMNFKKLFTKKLRMLTSTHVTNEQKVLWLKLWNQSSVLREAIKFPKHGFSNGTFDKWFYKATFWS
jgi:hypothetical protein